VQLLKAHGGSGILKMASHLSKKRKTELQTLCERYELNVSGTKTDIIERLCAWNAAPAELYLTVGGYCRYSRDAVELALAYYGNFQAVHVGKVAKTKKAKALVYIPVVEMYSNGKTQLIGGLVEFEAFLDDRQFDPNPATVNVQRKIWEDVLLSS